MKQVTLLLATITLFACGQGPQGIPGPVGSPATTLTPIALCPGADSYPTTFLEYAFCIDGQLYGVYSANGGFMSLLPPGTYNSNAIGSSCTVTILPNCGIQN